MTVRIAHFSDTHVLSLQGVGPRRFLNKRWTGALNLALNRARHYRVEVFEQLLQTIAELEPDHAICTGDLVNLALEPEFEKVAALLAEVFAPDALTLVPGNHDAYVKEAWDGRLFERHFGAWMPHDLEIGADGPFPVTRMLEGVAIVGLSSAIPTPVFLANGQVGTSQVAAMRVALRHPEARGRFRLLMLHHPLLREPTRRLEAMRRLDDAEAVIAGIHECGDAAPGLVVHGHNHAFKVQRVPQTDIPLVQVASASRAGNHGRAEFNVYVIDEGRLTAIERHIHAPDEGRFVRCDVGGEPLAA
ncbi:MAG: metallophosphoesterase [Myxococcales bacterium]|nr:metallophosphoesterase [Myxococcales bacterium]